MRNTLSTSFSVSQRVRRTAHPGGALPIRLVEQVRGRAAAHAPFRVVSQHTEKYMGPVPVRKPVIDGTQLQATVLDERRARLATESPL
jgi:hypothetical protein